jgi:hypothetical protein
MDIEHFVEDLHKIAKGQLIQTELDKPVAATDKTQTVIVKSYGSFIEFFLTLKC